MNSQRKQGLVNRMGDFYHNIAALFRLFISDFLKSGYNIFFALFYPFLLFAILSLALPKSISSSPSIIILTFGGIYCSTIFYICCNILGSNFLVFKNSTIIKSLSTTNISVFQLFLGILVPYLLISITSSSILWIWLYALNANDFTIYNFNFGIYFAATILLLVFSITLSFIICSFAKRPTNFTVLALMIYLISAFLSGQFFTVTLIDASNVLKIISMIFPQRHIYDLLLHGITSDYNNILWDNQFWSVYVYPLLFTGLMLVYLKFTFRLST